MMNLLSQRLRNAKRELTNLKTAHRRGVGNLKVYTTPVTITPTGESRKLVLSVNFYTNNPNYPFVQVYGTINNDGDRNLVFGGGGGYTNNGYTYKYMAGFREDYGNIIYVVSSQSPSSITYTWG